MHPLPSRNKEGSKKALCLVVGNVSSVRSSVRSVHSVRYVRSVRLAKSKPVRQLPTLLRYRRRRSVFMAGCACMGSLICGASMLHCTVYTLQRCSCTPHSTDRRTGGQKVGPASRWWARFGFGGAEAVGRKRVLGASRVSKEEGWGRTSCCCCYYDARAATVHCLTIFCPIMLQQQTKSKSSYKQARFL